MASEAEQVRVVWRERSVFLLWNYWTAILRAGPGGCCLTRQKAFQSSEHADQSHASPQVSRWGHNKRRGRGRSNRQTRQQASHQGLRQTETIWHLSLPERPNSAVGTSPAWRERRFQGSLGSVLFTAIVSLGLVSLGIFFVYFGDEKYIVDVMVLGGLCLVMGLMVFLMGFLFVLRPICKERQQREMERRRERSAQRRFSDQGNNFRNAAFEEEEGGAPLPRPPQAPPTPKMTPFYNRASLRAIPDPKGKLTPPSPPPLVQPLKDRPGTTSTVLTATDSEDVFHSEEDGLKHDNER